MKPRTMARLLTAAALLAGAVHAAAAPASIDLSTGAGWMIRYNDIAAQVGRSGPAFTYDCLGNAQGPQCLSITSTGYADGKWLPGADPSGFSGQWDAYIDFMLPQGATNVRLVHELLGVDDDANMLIMAGNQGLFFGSSFLGTLPPAGEVLLDGVWAAPGPHRLQLEVNNWDLFSSDNGTAAVGRFRMDFDLPGGNPVPEPGTLACAVLALGAAVGTRRRRGVGVTGQTA